MPCKEYEDIKAQWDFARSEYAYFAFSENKLLRGTSDRKSKQLAKEAQAKQTKLSRAMSVHLEECEECKKG